MTLTRTLPLFLTLTLVLTLLLLTLVLTLLLLTLVLNLGKSVRMSGKRNTTFDTWLHHWCQYKKVTSDSIHVTLALNLTLILTLTLTVAIKHLTLTTY